MKDEKKSSSKLSDLFEDLQDTLDHSIYNTDIEKPPKPLKPKPEPVKTVPQEPPKPPKPQQPQKIKQTEQIEEIEQIEELEQTKQTEETEEVYVTEEADMDLELLKAIGIGREENIAPPEKKPKTARESKERSDTPVLKKPSPKTFYRATEGEFMNRDQINDIFESYRNEYISALVRLAGGAILFLILFYMELAPYLKWKMPGILNIYYYNVPYIWIDMQILVLVAAINQKSLIYGVKSMFGGNINVYSISVFFLVISFVHTILTLNFRYNNPDMALYNSVSVYSMVMISLYNILDISSEIDSFKTVSSTKQKYALNPINPSKIQKSANSRTSLGAYESAAQEAELFRDVTAFGSNVGGVMSAPFVSNFFTRTYKDKHPGGVIKYFIYISVLAALSMFIITMGVNQEKDWYASLSSAVVLMLGSVPLCSFIALSYPNFKAQKKARRIGAAFIGSDSIEESSRIPIISVYDKDIFPPEKVRFSQIRPYNKHRIEPLVQHLCAISDKLNMPIAEALKKSANYDTNIKRDVRVIGIEQSGICFSVEGAKMFMGTEGYISNLGLIPPVSDVDEAFVKSLGCIMFLASEVEMMAKIYISYEITPDFYDIIKNIKKINACLCIRTFDPNIDDELVGALGSIKKYPVRVLKLKDTADIYKTSERVDAPVVAKESLKSLIGALVIADKIKTLMKTNVFLQILAFAAGSLLSVILGLAGQLLGLNAGHLFLFQSFWMLPVIILLAINN